jgi:hypothetical protein
VVALGVVGLIPPLERDYGVIVLIYTTRNFF